MRDINSMSRVNALALKRRNTVRTSSRTINGLVVYYVVRLGSMKGMGLGTSVQVPCCGQDGYRAQVLKHPNSFVIMKIPLNPYPSLIMKLNQYF